ncbi:hypothetical protein PoB_003266400 [Plakobranchus ocellatus]|uniref:Peptidase M12A domain-containing protein n=1 Tax=Plakobranchus ocellatus TaxID=259542 RepID=A0AAV4AI85_9GAST|nr:hypothetical protein PoB_003266400 [Plakobranchus ocellatus]
MPNRSTFLQYFARSPHLITLHTIDQRYQDVIGRAEKPSFYDLETVNRLYLCSAGCPRSLHCGDLCYMDKMCMCRCRAGYDKAYFSGPGPYRNNLPDSTCEFFASRGECTGNIKDTVRPLCAKSCGLHRYKFNTPSSDAWSRGAQPDVASSGNLVQQQQQQQLRQQLQQQQQNSKLGRIAGSLSSGGALLSPTSPSASMVWSSGNSINTVGNNMNFNNNNNNNFINSIYGNSNNMNSANDVQYLRGGGGGGSPRQQQQQRALQQQALLRDGGQFLPGADGRGQQARMALSSQQQQQQQQFRAAFLQRQAALSSSEPNLLRSLVLGRSSNGRTARLLLPAQVNSRSLQRRLSNGPSSISAAQRLGFLRQQDSTRVPLLARSGAALENLLSPVQGTRSRNRITRNSAFSGVSNWMGSDAVSQQREYDRNRQRRMNTGNDGLGRVSNAVLNVQNLARLSPTSSSVSATGRWRDVRDNRRFSVSGTQRQAANDFPARDFTVGGATQWRKPLGANFRSQNRPVTLDVERVSGPLPLAGFNRPEFGAGSGGAENDVSGSVAGSKDTAIIGENGVVNNPTEGTQNVDIAVSNSVGNDPGIAESRKKEAWETQASAISSVFSLQDGIVRPIQNPGDHNPLSYELSAFSGNSKNQGPNTLEQAPPPVPPIPPFDNNEPSPAAPTLWDSFAGVAASSTSVSGPSETARTSLDSVNFNSNNNNGNREPFIEALSLTGQPQPILIDPVNLSAHPRQPQTPAGTNSLLATKNSNNNHNSNNNRFQYDLWEPLQGQQQPQLKNLQRQPQSLFQRLNRFQAFSDPNPFKERALEEPNSTFQKDTSNLNISAADALPISHTATSHDQPSLSTETTSGLKLEGAGILLQGRRGTTDQTKPQGLFSAASSTQPESSMANQNLGLNHAFFSKGGNTFANGNYKNNNNDNNGNRNGNLNTRNNNNNNHNLFRSLINFGRRSSGFLSKYKARTASSVLFSLPTV